MRNSRITLPTAVLFLARMTSLALRPLLPGNGYGANDAHTPAAATYRQGPHFVPART